MFKRITFASLLAAALILLMAPTPMGASTYDKLTYLTFSGTVQIPGVILVPGTYGFRLTNPETTRNVLQVISHDGSTVFAMFHTTPDSRLSATEESMVTFRETPAGVPPAVRSLFYGGELSGYEFVYPRRGPDMTVRIWAQPDISYTAMPAAAMAEPTAGPAPAPGPTMLAERAAPELGTLEPAAPELPHTASPLPLVGLTGLGALFLGLGASLLSRGLGS